MQVWWQVDPKTEAQYGITPYAAMNNDPISLSDPEGDLPFLAAVAIGAGVGFLSNGAMNAANGQSFTNGWAQATALGALGGAASFGIGAGASYLGGTYGQTTLNAAGNIASLGWNPTLVGGIQAAAHGVSGGAISELGGGSFGSGFLSGAFSSGVGSLTSGWGPVGQLGAGSFSGGVGSVIGGGNFWNGAGQGLITTGLNHLAHKIGGIGNEYEEQSGIIEESDLAYAGKGSGINSSTHWRLKYSISKGLANRWMLDVYAEVLAQSYTKTPSTEGYLKAEYSGSTKVFKLNRSAKYITNGNSSYSYVGSRIVALPRTGKVGYSFTGKVQWGQGWSSSVSINIPFKYRPYLLPVYYAKKRN